MDPKAALSAFLDDPDAQTLAELAEELEDWPPAGGLLKLAARAVFVEDDRLRNLLDEAVREARRLLEAEA
ncbi:hypothetical protein [Oceanithermus sp.]